VIVGDTEADMAAAKRAGIPCISVSWGIRSEKFLKKHGATTIVRAPKELLHTLL